MSIKFSLVCGDCNAKFEGWFPGNKDYEKQLAKGQLICPMCDSTSVRKDIMAPNLTKKSNQKTKAKGNLMMSGRARQILKEIENNSHMYFVHSYEFIPEDKSVISSTTDYSSKIVCSVERDNLFGTQFHPEKSDKIGLKIIENFINL